MTLDEQFVGSVGHMDWESQGYKNASNRYDIEINGGANKLTMDAATT